MQAGSRSKGTSHLTHSKAISKLPLLNKLPKQIHSAKFFFSSFFSQSLFWHKHLKWRNRTEASAERKPKQHITCFIENKNQHLLLKYICASLDNGLPGFCRGFFPLAQNRYLQSHPKPSPITAAGQVLALPPSLSSMSPYASNFTACSYVQVSRHSRDINHLSNSYKQRSEVNKMS